ncbi:MAG: nitroreductase [Woeseia sp.]|nr:nitroreductase [Woeseia sp.]|tara:strand:+ start:277 stop:945 length:669 start_codon:yes stop_codon:yes gene_type:complete
MELYDVMRTTFAAREYTGEDIPEEVLYEILDNARFAPSGGNRQGNHVIIIRDQKTREKLVEILTPPAKRYHAQVKAGENPWNSVSQTNVSAAEISQTPPPARLMEPYGKASCLLAIALDLRVVASMDQYLDRVGVISGASIYPFVWNILMAARQAGFGGTITTLAAAEEPKVQEILKLPRHFAVASIVPLGKPVKQLTKLKRHSVEDMTTHETFDGSPFLKP